jgi:hypothetical protein
MAKRYAGRILAAFFLIRETPPYRAMGGGAGEALVGEESYDPEIAGTGAVIALRLDILQPEDV